MKEENKKKKRNKEQQTKLWKKILKFCIKCGFILFIWLLVIIATLLIYYSKDLPKIDLNKEINKDVSIAVLYSNNQVIKFKIAGYD